MNFLSLFVLIPLLMMAGLALSKEMKQIRAVAVIGSSLQLVFAFIVLFMFLGERAAGNTAEMLFVADTVWYAPLDIHYTVGVDGVSVAMLLLSAIVVFAGVFASWKIDPLPKEFFLWLILLSIGVFGFLFRSTSLRCSCSMRSLLSRCIFSSECGVAVTKPIRR